MAQVKLSSGPDKKPTPGATRARLEEAMECRVRLPGSKTAWAELGDMVEQCLRLLANELDGVNARLSQHQADMAIGEHRQNSIHMRLGTLAARVEAVERRIEVEDAKNAKAMARATQSQNATTVRDTDEETQDMYVRFTDRARKVMQLANQEAQRFNHEYIRTDHILLGLIKEGSGVAANVLRNLDINLANVWQDVENMLQGEPDKVTMGKLPQTPWAKGVIQAAMDEARGLHHNYVGTEHILLGLLRDQEGLCVTGTVLGKHGLTREAVRWEVVRVLGPEPTRMLGILQQHISRVEEGADG